VHSTLLEFEVSKATLILLIVWCHRHDASFHCIACIGMKKSFYPPSKVQIRGIPYKVLL